MFEETPMSSGIYRITNVATGNLYIGSAVNLRRRWKFHIYQLERKIHHNPRLQSAWDKYGTEAFKFDILELVESRADLLATEQKYLDLYDAAQNRLFYNFFAVAGSSAGTTRSPEVRQKISDGLKGRKVSPESREKMRQAKLGKLQDPAHTAKIAEANRGKKQRPKSEQEKALWRKLTPDQIREFRALREQGWSLPTLAKHFGVGFSTAQRIASGRSYASVI